MRQDKGSACLVEVRLIPSGAVSAAEFGSGQEVIGVRVVERRSVAFERRQTPGGFGMRPVRPNRTLI